MVHTETFPFNWTVSHGSQLHEKYALPFYLQQDLHSIFRDIQEPGLPLHESIKSILLEEPVRHLATGRYCWMAIPLLYAGKKFKKVRCKSSACVTVISNLMLVCTQVLKQEMALFYPCPSGPRWSAGNHLSRMAPWRTCLLRCTWRYRWCKTTLSGRLPLRLLALKALKEQRAYPIMQPPIIVSPFVD